MQTHEQDIAANALDRELTSWSTEAAIHASISRNQGRSRNLVVVRAGDHSLHSRWISDRDRSRDFDLFISYYGSSPGRYAGTSEYYEVRRGPKWPCISALVREHATLIDKYQCVWFPDDDISAEAATIERMFAFCHAYRLCLAQPALTEDSYCSWRTLRQDPTCHLRFTQFVEIMAPVFSREALRVCAPSFNESATGWGLDWLWPRLCREANLGRLAVIDATPVCHTRPCGGELYRSNPELDPRGDAERVLQKYGLYEARAAAKYPLQERVREVPPPPTLRLAYALRKLNGRRKYRPR